MTPSEFNEWKTYHANCVGGFSDWLAKGRSDHEQREVLRLWHEALADVSLDDAKHASMAIMRGDIEVIAFGNHPKAIRQYAKNARGGRLKRERRFVDGREVFRCPDCLDGGWVACYHPSAIKEVIRNRLECVKTTEAERGRESRRYMPAMKTCTYACHCDEGGDARDRGATVYDRERCIRVTAHTHELQIDELFRETDSRVEAGVKNRPNYTSDFDQFNQAGYVNQEIQF